MRHFIEPNSFSLAEQLALLDLADRMELVPHKLHQLGVLVRHGVHNHFGGQKSCQGIKHSVHHFAAQIFAHKHLSRGNVSKGKAYSLFLPAHGAQIVIPLVVQSRRVHNRSRSHHPNNLAANQTLCLGGVLRLLADCNAAPCIHKLNYIAVHRMKGNTAHGRSLFKTATLFCQGNVQNLSRLNSVLKKHLVKVAQPVHQDTVRIFVLCFAVLAHHRR